MYIDIGIGQICFEKLVSDRIGYLSYWWIPSLKKGEDKSFY